MADGPVVATKPGNAGGAKGLYFRANARRGRRAEGLAMSLPTLLKVQKLQAALHAKAKGSPSVRCYTLYDKVYRADVLEEAYERCRKNGGAAGVDGQTFEDIEAYGVQTWLGELAQPVEPWTETRRIGCASGCARSTRCRVGEQHATRTSTCTRS